MSLITDVTSINRSIDAVMKKKALADGSREEIRRRLNTALQNYVNQFGRDILGSTEAETIKNVRRRKAEVESEIQRQLSIAQKAVELIDAGKMQEARDLLGAGEAKKMSIPEIRGTSFSEGELVELGKPMVKINAGEGVSENVEAAVTSQPRTMKNSKPAIRVQTPITEEKSSGSGMKLKPKAPVFTGMNPPENEEAEVSAPRVSMPSANVKSQPQMQTRQSISQSPQTAPSPIKKSPLRMSAPVFEEDEEPETSKAGGIPKIPEADIASQIRKRKRTVQETLKMMYLTVFQSQMTMMTIPLEMVG